MTTNARIRVNFRSREFEVDGSEQFVREYTDQLKELLGTENAYSICSSDSTSDPASAAQILDVLPTEFGEYYHSFTCKLTDNDKILIAAFYLQQRNDDNQFATGKANDLLQLHSIKVSNPSLCVKRNIAKRRIFALSKRSFKVSDIGLAYIQEIHNKH